MFKKIVSVCLLSVSLAACNHQNPLASPYKRKVADALVTSSQYAERQMKLHLSPGGYMYADCMDGKAKIDCNTLYRWMLKDLRQQSSFKNITREDLIDNELWQTTEEEYLAVQFNLI